MAAAISAHTHESNQNSLLGAASTWGKLLGTCSQEALAHVSSTRTFAVHISPDERDLLRLMQVPLELLVWLDADSTSRGQSCDSSVPWRTVERRRVSDPLSVLVAWRAGERFRRHHTSPFNI